MLNSSTITQLFEVPSMWETPPKTNKHCKNIALKKIKAGNLNPFLTKPDFEAIEAVQQPTTIGRKLYT